MGGIGSGGRIAWTSKATTASCKRIDVRRWSREGLLEGGVRFVWQWHREGKRTDAIDVAVRGGNVVLSYRLCGPRDEWHDVETVIRLASQPCHLGGVRQWFLCPGHGCGRRVAILYSRGRFACRRCQRLVYPSQREQAWERAQRRADGIRSRLGWEVGTGRLYGQKPKHMHWVTFDRHLSAIDHFDAMSHDEFVKHFERRYGALMRFL